MLQEDRGWLKLLCFTSSEYIYYSWKSSQSQITFDFGGKTYIKFKISFGNIALTVEYFVSLELVVRHLSKIQGVETISTSTHMFGRVIWD